MDKITLDIVLQGEHLRDRAEHSGKALYHLSQVLGNSAADKSILSIVKAIDVAIQEDYNKHQFDVIFYIFNKLPERLREIYKEQAHTRNLGYFPSVVLINAKNGILQFQLGGGWDTMYLGFHIETEELYVSASSFSITESDSEDAKEVRNIISSFKRF